METTASLPQLHQRIVENTPAVARLGGWPDTIAADCLSARLPRPGDTNAPGFDAGIAVALGMIPPGRQRLAAQLHANYTKEAILQVRREMVAADPNAESVWWLAANSLCTEGGVNEARFRQQLATFQRLAQDPEQRRAAALEMFRTMTSVFELRNGIPFGEHDGSIVGAYLAGHRFCTNYNAHFRCFFIGTYEESLGLEEFPWSTATDALGERLSGPMFGSRQFVRCSTQGEFDRAVAAVQQHLGPSIAH